MGNHKHLNIESLVGKLVIVVPQCGCRNHEGESLQHLETRLMQSLELSLLKTLVDVCMSELDDNDHPPCNTQEKEPHQRSS